MQITQNEFKEFFDDSISVKRQQALRERVNSAVHFVVHRLALIGEYEIDWYDYDNEDGEYHPGYFDLQAYQKTISLVGEFNKTENSYTKYLLYFPTQWLWEDFEDELMQEIAQVREKSRLDKERKNTQCTQEQERFEVLKSQVLAKLTPQEQAMIQFIDIRHFNQRMEQANLHTKAQEVYHNFRQNDATVLVKSKKNEYLKSIGQSLGMKSDLSASERKRIMAIVIELLQPDLH